MKTKANLRFTRPCLLLACMVLCGGCGTRDNSQQTSPEKSGSPLSASPTALQPADALPIIYAARDLAKVLDLAALPALKGTEFENKSAAWLNARAPGPVPEVIAFYKQNLKTAGWLEAAHPDRKNTDEYGSFEFTKEGHILDLEVYPFDGPKDKGPMTMVNMTFRGNFDTRSLPRPEGSEVLLTGQAVSTYLLTQTVAQARAWLEQNLTKLGWQGYDAFDQSKEAPSDHPILSYRKQGYALMIYLGTHPLQHKTFMQYAVQALAHELPTPANSSNIEFDDKHWRLRCQVPGDMKTAAAFYQKALPELDYQPLPSEQPQPKYWNLRFGTKAGDIVLVQVFQQDDRTTKILIDGIPAAVMAKLKQDERKKAE